MSSQSFKKTGLEIFHTFELVRDNSITFFEEETKEETKLKYSWAIQSGFQMQ